MSQISCSAVNCANRDTKFNGSSVKIVFIVDSECQNDGQWPYLGINGCLLCMTACVLAISSAVEHLTVRADVKYIYVPSVFTDGNRGAHVHQWSLINMYGPTKVRKECYK